MTELRQQTLIDAVELAARAPSVHNTQPWRFGVGPGRIELHADPDRWLPITDAEGRDLMVSCGAALHHLRVALAAARVDAKVHRLPDRREPLHLATLDIGGHLAPAVEGSEILSSILTRRTDRRSFGNWPLPDSFIHQLADEAAAQGAVLRQVTEADATQALLRTVQDARDAQDLLTGYAEETQHWTGREGIDGIPRSNLPRSGEQVEVARSFGDGELPDQAHRDWAALFALGTASDDPLSRLRAGEALSAVLLKATHHGLASCPLSQPLEVSATREVIEERVLEGTLSPQILIRIGWAPAGLLPATPRRPVHDILDPLSS